MNNINEIQVQSTNDASAVSKCSATSRNYFKDDFVQEFIAKKKSRASLINLGYYTRAVILNKLLTEIIAFLNFQKVIKFQIISLGAGFDTTYWRLSEANLLSKSLFVEIDFPNVIQRKIALIKQSKKLQSYLSEPKCWKSCNEINKLSFNYYLLEADLSDINLIQKLFNDIVINYDIPTLFLSECVVVYMKEFDSRKLIDWFNKNFKNNAFVNYEQIHPEDGFGQVMIKHFDRLQTSLLSVSEYPDCVAQYFRFKKHGYEKICCLSEWDAFSLLVPEEERKAVLLLELFDEFEEFHLKCVHYVVTYAGSGILSDWMNPFSSELTSLKKKVSRPYLEGHSLVCELELFRHFSCNAKEFALVFGGCNSQGRSSQIYKISYENQLDIKPIKIQEQDLRFDMVFGTAAYFELNRVPFVCIYGGRTSPDKVWNNGSPIVFEIAGDELLERLIVHDENPTPRYRSRMASLNSTESEVNCWIFGGRTTNLKETLSDFWKLTIKCDVKGNLTSEWTQFEKKNDNWPCGRMSHSFVACPKRFELFMVGGLTLDSTSVLNDMWKWSCRSESWEKVHLSGVLLPRYGHTSHLKDDVIYLIGGVNTLAGVQPGLAKIDLKNLTVTEYEISATTPEMSLFFNHTSEIFGEGRDAKICIIGGGGNCFSFGTQLNRGVLCIRLSQTNWADSKTPVED